MEHKKSTRIILFGKSGDGKSSFGNTLIGKQHFKVSAFSPGIPVCETADITTESGRNLKIVETPGIIEQMGGNMLDLVQSHFDFLAPGPNVIIIVLMPRRFTKEDETAVSEIFNFFGDDDHFLDHTILVMVRKSEIVDVCTNIAEFMENTASDSMKKLYKGCCGRIVAVENKQSWEDRQTDAEEVFKEIDKLEGYYDWKYFSKVHELKQIKMEINKPTNETEEIKPHEKRKDKNKEGSDGCNSM